MAYNIGATCTKCGKYKSFEVDPKDYARWRDGLAIEHAFPHLTGMQRMMLLTKLCCVCQPSPQPKE